jgi:hypothetical protein
MVHNSLEFGRYKIWFLDLGGASLLRLSVVSIDSDLHVFWRKLFLPAYETQDCYEPYGHPVLVIVYTPDDGVTGRRNMSGSNGD